MNSLDKLQDKLDYKFQNLDLLRKALIHRSFLNENKKLEESNERLEFLGDAVLELISSEFLYNQFPEKPEGELTSLRAKIVQTRTLAEVANKLTLGKYLCLSKGEEATGGRENTSILADLTEATIGAIYLDSGFESAQIFINKHILKNYKILIAQAHVEDYKSKLQELVQAKGGIAPTYDVIEEKGPDHDKVFTIQVVYFDKPQETAQGKSKQIAQQNAAKKALEKLEQ